MPSFTKFEKFMPEFETRGGDTNVRSSLTALPKRDFWVPWHVKNQTLRWLNCFINCNLILIYLFGTCSLLDNLQTAASYLMVKAGSSEKDIGPVVIMNCVLATSLIS
jgi:hypothetical protein